jgi:hypothetical protein
MLARAAAAAATYKSAFGAARKACTCGIEAEAQVSFQARHPAPEAFEVYLQARELGLRRTCDLLREVVNNPCRPASLDASRLASTSAPVLILAQGIYADRAFDRLPLLADALEDAGCTDPDLLRHLRSPGPHVRGCWAVDALLGRG